ncbi:hypothetical protein FKX85_06560 [Echinicola soli]|uniref:Terpene synthase n=1 Tax=Echinicola soli TaxID=2591634 RepID=A0A514CGD6_9BACT|nr:terpene synthase family protein [Echinicola soli]QDH78714.1 hypothetical protein FKX85_06560 [Echinicola soli]
MKEAAHRDLKGSHEAQTTNPFTKITRIAVRKWTEERGLFLSDRERNRAYDQNQEDFAAYAYPHANKEELFHISKLFLVLFCLDDRADGLGAGERTEFWNNHLADFKKIRSGKLSPDNAVGRVFKDLHWYWFRDRARRFNRGLKLVRQVEKFITSGLWEAANLERNNPPSLLAYRKRLKHCSGSGIALELLTYISSLGFTMETYESPAFLDLKRTAVRLICLSNDLDSHYKEALSGDFHNLVLLKKHYYHIGLEECIDRVRKEYGFVREVYRRQVYHFLSTGPGSFQEKQQLVGHLHEMLNGLETWARKVTSRYRE